MTGPLRPVADESTPWVTWTYATVVLLMFTGLLVWQGIYSVRTFVDAQRQVAIASVKGTASEIEIILNELQRSVGIFADEKADIIQHLSRSPGDPLARETLDTSISNHFPEVYAWALSDDTGDTLLEEEPWLIGTLCRMDIQDFAMSRERHWTRVHTNPDGSHFDVMATVPVEGDRSGLVFFVSVSPSMLSRVLESSQAPGHKLYLMLSDMENNRIEVSDAGWVSTYRRPEPGFEIGPDTILHSRRIPHTRWTLVDVVDPALIENRERSAWIQGIMLLLAILAATVVMLVLLRRSERLRSRTRASLRESHATLSALVESVSGGVYLKDAGGRYLLVNQAYARWCGREASELAGLTDRDILPEHTAGIQERRDRTVMSARRPSTLEEDDPHNHGRTELVSRTPFLDASGEVAGLVGIRHDITELKQTRERLHRQEMELAHIDRLGIMGELAASLAHELNQPLGAISNYANACLRIVKQKGVDPAQLVDVLKDTVTQAKRAGKIIRKARAFVRKEPRNPECADPVELVREAVDLAGTRAHSTGIRIEVDASSNLPMVRCDRHQIVQVLLNLVFNAIEAISPAGGTIRIGVHPDGERQIRVTVGDSGPGLTPETATRIFEPFYTTRPDGTGMGLALCRSIIESHSGHIWAEEPGSDGATFHFTLPENEECNR